MPVLVTGGAGFIGSNLVDELLAQRFEVTVVDNFSEGKRENLPVNHPKLEVVRGDICDLQLMKRLCDNKSWVFHLAADSRIQTGLKNPILAAQNNLLGTATVLEAARLTGVKRVVYSASSSAYGNKNNPPMKEDMQTDCLNPYSLTKKVGEELCELYNKLYGLSTISLRYFNVYGPKHQEEGAYATVIAIFMKQLRYNQPLTIVGTGEQRRDFTFVSDVVRANIIAAMNHEATGVFNIGTGKNYSINDVAKLVCQVGGKTEHDLQYIEPRLGEAEITLADATKAKEVLGWTPNISLEQGLQITQKFQSANSLIKLI